MSVRIRHFLRGRANPDNADGIIRHVYGLAHAQLQLGHDVEIYGIGARISKPERIDREGLTVWAWPPTRSPFGVQEDLLQRLWTVDRETDILHIHMPHDPALPGLSKASADLGIPFVISPHAMWNKNNMARHPIKKRAFKTLVDRRVIERAAAVMATGTVEVPDIEAYAPRARIIVIRNAVDLRKTRAPSGELDYWTRFPTVDKDTRIYTFLGRLDPYQKGLDVLLDAWAIASRENENLSLALVGPPWRETEGQLQDQIIRLGLEGRVIRPGSLFGDEKLKALASSDVYIQVSRYETTPYSIQEALACGIPAILTSATALAREVESQGAGWCVDMDAESVAQAVVKTATMSRSSLNQMGKLGRTLIEQRYDLARSAERYIEAYASVLNGTPFVNDD